MNINVCNQIVCQKTPAASLPAGLYRDAAARGALC